jgi:hypothetical protein
VQKLGTIRAGKLNLVAVADIEERNVFSRASRLCRRIAEVGGRLSIVGEPRSGPALGVNQVSGHEASITSQQGACQSPQWDR